MNNQVDLAVIGSGAAGIVAAVTAARAGCSTLLLDQNPCAGGTGGFSGLTTLCGLYDDEGHYLNEGFPREFAEALRETDPIRMGRLWVLPYRPARFREVAGSFLSEVAVRTLWNTRLADCRVHDGLIARINDVKVRAVIDASGTAEVAQAIGEECMTTDERTQAPATVFPLANVTRQFHTLADAAAVLLPLGRAGFPPLSIQPNPEPSTLTIKFTGPPEQAREVVTFLRKQVKGFENCHAPVRQFKLSQRAGRMVIGKYLLTGEDVLAARKFPDAVARCAWPIEQWNEAGKASFRYLPPGAYYEVPARALQAARTQNLFMAGKTISADVDAIASARVMGCCLATGAAAGELAAGWLKSASL